MSAKQFATFCENWSSTDMYRRKSKNADRAWYLSAGLATMNCKSMCRLSTKFASLPAATHSSASSGTSPPNVNSVSSPASDTIVQDASTDSLKTCIEPSSQFTPCWRSGYRDECPDIRHSIASTIELLPVPLPPNTIAPPGDISISPQPAGKPRRLFG